MIFQDGCFFYLEFCETKPQFSRRNYKFISKRFCMNFTEKLWYHNNFFWEQRYIDYSFYLP